MRATLPDTINLGNKILGFNTAEKDAEIPDKFIDIE